MIAIPRLISILLTKNSEELRGRISHFAIAQTLVMTFLMSLAGAVFSLSTGLKASLLEALLQGQPVIALIQNMALPTLLYTVGGLLMFLVLYYGLLGSILDLRSLQAMRKIRAGLGPDGCILYSVVEEVLARWGLMNVSAYFGILFTGQKSAAVIWISIFFSGIFFGLGQLPAYFAAGSRISSRFIFCILLLHLWQAILFGWLFWQYDLVASIVGHMLFQVGWLVYDRT